MSGRYLLILVSFILASFGTILFCAETVFWFLRNPLLRLIVQLPSRQGVTAHLVLRFLPAALAVILTAICAVPGYVRGEPMSTDELPGPALIALAALGLYSIVIPFARSAVALFCTSTRTRRWLQQAVDRRAFSGFPLVELPHEYPVLAAAGILRKRIFLSRAVQSLLSAIEFRLVLRHEAAHCERNHNLAKMFWMVAPRLLSDPAVQEMWFETIEYAADDDASIAPADALNLASAVVVLAKQTPPIAESFLSSLATHANAGFLERRIQRLVRPRQYGPAMLFTKMASASLAILALTGAIGSLPVAQHAFRETLELLVR